MDLNTSARVLEYRGLAAKDAKAQAAELGLSAQETKSLLFDADSNAIWDAQQGSPYQKHLYKKPIEASQPRYTELGFLSDEEYKRIMGLPRPK